MYKIFLITCVFIGISSAELKVEKVLETESIEEYNQWVMRQKAEYPRLKPFYLNVEQVKSDKEWKVIYFDDDGTVAKEEVLKAKPGWWLHVHHSSYGGIVFVVESDSSLGESSPHVRTIKNRTGDTLSAFASFASGRFLPGGHGLCLIQGRENRAELLTWDGERIGMIENLPSFNIGSKATPDGRYMVLNSVFTAVVVKEGEELWRKTFPSAIEVGVSDDGQFIAIGDAGTVYVYNQQGDLLYSFCFSPKAMTNPRPVFSSDNRYLVASLPMELALIDNETGKSMWQQQVEGDAYYSDVHFAKGAEYIVLGYLERIFIYDLAGNLLMTIRDSRIRSRWQVFDDVIIVNTEKEEFHKVIYRLE